MAEKKITKTTTVKKPEKKENKVSLEELKRRKEEVLARINAEIGDGDDEQVVVEDKKEEAEVVKKDEAIDEADKKELEEEILGDTSEDDRKEIVDVSEEEKIQEVSRDKEQESEPKKEEPDRSHEDELSSTFSAAEFGIADKKGNKGKNIILFLIVFLVVAVISAAFYFYFTGVFGSNKSSETSEVVPTEVPMSTPTPIEFDRAALSIQVLNGSGVGGAAGEIQTVLEDIGYEDIEVGNAENSDYLNITIQLKEEFEEFADLISKDLSDSYVVNDDYEVLDEDSEYDVVIIVGSEEEAEESDE